MWRRVTRPLLKRAALVTLLTVVATACGSGQAPGTSGGSASRATSPAGVLLWAQEGSGSWPPDAWALPLEGGDPSRVDLSTIRRAVDWAWAPDLSRLVWVEEVPSGVPGARVVMGSPDGTSRTVIGELRHWDDYRGRAWSADGSRFAYAAYTDTGASVWVVDAGSGTSTAVRTWDEPVSIDLDWSPDATRLVVGLSGDMGQGGVFTMAADGSDERRIADRPATHVRWSPDGTTIAVGSYDDGGPPGIYAVAADGGSERRLSPPDVVEMMPFWSPDGRWIAFASERDATDPPAPDEPRAEPLIDAGIYVMRPDGSDVRNVVEPADRGWNEPWGWFASWPPPA